MPTSRATARSESAAAPTSASCRRAASVISAVSSARTRSRAVGTRARMPEARSPIASVSTALDSEPQRSVEHRSRPRAPLSSDDRGAPMALHVIVGKGPVGTTTAAELVARGHQVRVLSRSGGPSTDAVEHRQVDAADADAARAPPRGARRRSTTPSTRPTTAGPPTGRRSPRPCSPRPSAPAPSWSRWRNLYGYGRPSGPMTPQTPAGRHRRQGPGAPAGCGPTRSPRTRPAGCGSPRRGPRTSSGRRCPPATRTWSASCRRCAPAGGPGSSATRTSPRSWAYLPDVAATLATLGTDERALGRAWHVPSAPPRSQRQALGDLAAAMGVPAVAGERHPVAGAAGRRRRRPDDARGRGRPAPVRPGVRHRRPRDDGRPSG